MNNNDDEQLISMFDTAVRNQFAGGAIAAILGVVALAAIFVSPMMPVSLLAAAIFGFFAVKQVTDYRKQASRDREYLKYHIERYYVPSSGALRKVIRDAVEKGLLPP